MSIERDLQFIYEVGCVRNIQRAWKQYFGPNFANLAEHHFRVTWIAIILAKNEVASGNKVDQEKVLKMAMVHDISESRTGDVHFISRLYTKRDESSAITDSLHETALDPEFIDLWHEYEKRECIEARIVKDADNLDVDFEIHEQAHNGNSLEKEWYQGRKDAIYPRFFTESAKRIWEQVYDSNPNDWHTKAKNRINFGDLSSSPTNQ